MPDTPASIISLNFDPKGLSETQQGAKELEGIFGRIGGTFEKLGKNIAGLAGVAGIGQIVHQFMRIEQSAVRTSLAVNNIRGGNDFTSRLAGAQAATGTDAIDIAGGIRASQQFAGGGFLRSPTRAGNYGQLLGHMAQATGFDATTLGTLLGQGLSIQGDRFSQAGAQGLLSQAYTASARAGQGGMTGEFLQALTGLVRSTGFFTGGANRGQMAGFMGAAMAGDPRFADPGAAASAVGNVMGVIQGSLTNPRMMAALQMSGSNIHDILRGDPRSAQRLAQFARSQGKLPSDLFFFNTFGQEGGALMSDLADGKITPGQFAKKMKQTDPQAAMKGLMDRAAQQEDTAIAQLKKLEGSVVKDVAGPLKHIEHMLAGILGHGDLVKGALGLYGGSKLLGMLGKRGLGGRFLRGLGGRAVGGAASADALEAMGLGGLLGAAGIGAVGSGVLGFGAGEAFLDHTHRYKHTGPFGLLRRGKTDEELDLDHLPDNMKHIISGLRGKSRRKQEAYLKSLIKDYAGSGDETNFQIVQKLSEMLKYLRSLDDKSGKGGGSLQGASFMGGNAMGGAASGNIMAAFVSGGGGSLAGISSLFPGGIGALGGSGGSGTSPASYTPGGGTKSGGGWKSCLLTYYKPSLGGINSSGSGKHYANGDRVNENSDMVCAAPKEYAFGTVIEFAIGNRTVKCVVKDRGGAINGQHFDLIWAAAKVIGLDRIGKTHAQFRVISAGTTKNPKAGAPGSAGNPIHVPGGGGQAQSSSVGGGGDFGGMAIGGGFPQGTGGGSTTINVNLDNRRIEQQRHRTRAM